MDQPLDFIRERLDRADRAGLRRSMLTVGSRQGRLVEVGGRQVLSFSSNDYLGLAGDERLAEAACEALRRYGVGSAASRLVSGNTTLHEALEARLARFKGTEAAILFATGHAANVGTIPALVGRGDLIACDRLNHASIIDGCRLSGATLRVYPHGDVARLERVLRRAVGARRRLIVTDTVFSMDGDVAPLPALVEVAGRYNAILMVDEAHATGVLGERGRGAAEALGVSDAAPVQMGTLSKALGCLGGYVAGTAALIDFLRQEARSFVYSTAPPPAICAAAIRALDIVEAEPERRRHCLDLADRLRSGIAGLGGDVRREIGGPHRTPDPAFRTPTRHAVPRFPVTPIVPVVVGEAERACRAAEALFERGYLVRAIRPPTVPAGTSRLRITVTAAHTEADVDGLVQALRAVLE